MDHAQFAADVLAWFDAFAVDLPWRGSPDLYRVWLSEIMLQQTQIASVIPYFERFLKAYPTVSALANAPLDAVLKQWEGLGYYSRARNLHRAAEIVAHKHEGIFPNTAAGLLELPGVGRYTANAIASMAYGERVPVLDGNVIRVLARLYDIAEDVGVASTQTRLWTLAESLLSGQRPGDYNQAMMDLGREVCKARHPRCAKCPISGFCASFANGTQAERPVKAKKAPTPEYALAAGVIRDGQGRYLVGKRPKAGLLGGLWEFPAERCAPDEALDHCLARLLGQTLGIQAEPGGELICVRHAFTHFKIRLHVFECRYDAGNPQPNAEKYTEMRWLTLDELNQLAFARADRKVIDFLAQTGQQRLF